jgi:muramoyltetrapeptide carboxypeptidase
LTFFEFCLLPFDFATFLTFILMNRKDFIGASGLLLAGSTLTSWKSAPSDDSVIYRRPPYLKQGDTIGITAPAGFITSEELKPAVALMESWGFRIRYGNTIDKKDNSFGGTDEERLLDFQQLLDDPSIKAIMCARGGYGSVRIVDQIRWEKFKLHPKWVIGFSDITVLHGHIHSNCQVATLHSKMTNSFPDDWSKAEPIQIETIESIRDALTGKKMTYMANLHERNRMGTGTGPLIGGNLKTIETLAGSASDIRTAGKLLFVEDVGEYLYSIDRMFWNLQRTGKLKSLKGLIVGGFRVKPDDPGEEFGKTVQDIVWRRSRTTATRYVSIFR